MLKELNTEPTSSGSAIDLSPFSRDAEGPRDLATDSSRGVLGWVDGRAFSGAAPLLKLFVYLGALALAAYVPRDLPPSLRSIIGIPGPAATAGRNL